jgi:hypothetical protein
MRCEDACYHRRYGRPLLRHRGPPAARVGHVPTRLEPFSGDVLESSRHVWDVIERARNPSYSVVPSSRLFPRIEAASELDAGSVQCSLVTDSCISERPEYV